MRSWFGPLVVAYVLFAVGWVGLVGLRSDGLYEAHEGEVVGQGTEEVHSPRGGSYDQDWLELRTADGLVRATVPHFIARAATLGTRISKQRFSLRYYLDGVSHWSLSGTLISVLALAFMTALPFGITWVVRRSRR